MKDFLGVCGVILALLVLFGLPVTGGVWLESSERTVAHRQGVTCGRAGMPSGANPHKSEGPAAAWQEGWAEGFAEREREKQP